MGYTPREQIDKINFFKLTWQQFEDLSAEYINEIFDEKNTVIEHTAYQNDGGKDIILQHFSKVANLTVWIECKKHKENIGLEVIGKNIILVMSKHINKLIFLSASLITNSAKDNILLVAEAHGFEVAFLDGENYKRELLKYPNILKHYFPDLTIQDSSIEDNGPEIRYFISEFQEDCGDSKYPRESVLYRNYNFYFKILLQNRGGERIKDVEVACFDYKDNFVIGRDVLRRDFISPMSDTLFSFYCESVDYSKKKKLPTVRICYKIGEDTKAVELKTEYVRQECVLRFKLVGKAQIEFLANDVTRAHSLCCNGYSQFIVLHGASGTGKTRMLEEIENKFKRSGFNLIHLDCSHQTSIRLLKAIIKKLLCFPSGLAMEWLEEDRLTQYFADINKDAKFFSAIKSFIQGDYLNAANLKLISKAILLLLDKPVLNNHVLLILDNIQDADSIIEDLVKDINDYFKDRRSHVCVVVAMNTEVTGKNGLDQESFLQYAEQVDASVSSMCNILELQEFQPEEARLFLEMAFPRICNRNDLADTLLHKSGYRPFDLITMFQYMQENQIVVPVSPPLWVIPNPDKFAEFLETVPAKNKSMIKRRLGSLINNLTENEQIPYQNLIAGLLLCKNQLPEEFLNVLQIPNALVDRLIQSAIIKFDLYSPVLSFYHDNLYRYYCNNAPMMALSFVSTIYIKWTQNVELPLSAKVIRFNSYLNARKKAEAIEYGMGVMYECQSAYEMQLSVEIGKELHNEKLLRKNPEQYFYFLILYGENLWESVDAETAIDVYREIHEILPQLPSNFSVDELCKYYHEYINALFHIGQHKKTLPLLEEFSQIPDKSKKYQFILNNRYSVYYFRSKNFFLAKTYIEKSISCAQEMNDDFWLSTAYSEMAYNYMLNKNDGNQAISFFTLSNQLYHEAEDKTYYRKIEITNQKALVELLSGHYDQAICEINKSIAYSLEINNTYMTIKAYNILGIILAMDGKLNESIGQWKKAVCMAERIKSMNWIIGLHCNIGVSFILQSQVSQSRYHFNVAWDCYKSKHNIESIPANNDIFFYNLLLFWRMDHQEENINLFCRNCKSDKLLSYLHDLQTIEDYWEYCRSEYQSLLGVGGLNFCF